DFLFIAHSCDRTDLHSFPTRRSSDLRAEAEAGREAVLALRNPFRVSSRAAAESNPFALHEGECSPCAWNKSVQSESLKYGLHSRSEEHTSELQSRGHLVCRLLLEKKI